MQIKFEYKKIISDTLTPVGVYLNLRDQFPNAIMLESSDYHGDEHNFSYLGIDKIGGFQLKEEQFKIQYPNQTTKVVDANSINVADEINKYIHSFEVEELDLPFIYKGLF